MNGGVAVCARGKPARWKTWLAFAVIYFVWGGTFLAIRIGVYEVPPLLFAAVRFSAAGAAMYAWLAVRGERSPSWREWKAIVPLAAMIFVMDYGLLFWAERRVPSGLAAVVLATIPACMALSEILILRTQRMTARLAAALAIGTCGVVALVSRTLHLGGEPVDRRGAAALIVAAVSWSIAAVLTKKVPLPESKLMTSAAQMLAGGLLLALVAGGTGEFHDFHLSAMSRGVWIALAYLIVFGSIVAFTAYVWLIHHESPTKVGTYAYVNPLVAVMLGYFFGGEDLGPRAIAGSACVLASVVMITTGKSGEVAEGQSADLKLAK